VKHTNIKYLFNLQRWCNGLAYSLGCCRSWVWVGVWENQRL